MNQGARFEVLRLTQGSTAPFATVAVRTEELDIQIKEQI